MKALIKVSVPSLHRKKVLLRSLMTNAKSVEACPLICVPDVDMLSAYAVAGEENMSQKLYEICCRKDLFQCTRNLSEAERLGCVWPLKHNRPLRMTVLEIRR